MPIAPDTVYAVRYHTAFSGPRDAFLRNVNPVLWATVVHPLFSIDRITLDSWQPIPDGPSVIAALTKHRPGEPPEVIGLNDLLDRCVAILNDQGSPATHDEAQKLLDILIKYGDETGRAVGPWLRYMTPLHP